MKFTRTLSAISLALIAAMGMSSMAEAVCDPLPKTTIGDVDANGFIDILDVVGVVGTAFRNLPASRYLGSDDLNGDGVSSDVLDVVGVVGKAFRNEQPIFAFRLYPLTGRSGAGTRTLIADDSIQYLVQGVYSIGVDTLTSLLPPPSSCPKSDTIRIQAGTDIWGDSGSVVSAFVVRRYGYIQSVGTEADPIIFTSRFAPGARNRGDWGGFVVNGCDSCNETSGQFLSEGNGGIGGGFMSGDNSGCIEYTRQEFSGHVFVANNELNGITLNGVGRGTTIDHVQVNQNLDDGIEWFGGTVNIKYAIVSGCDDDGYDTDLGCNFHGQFLIDVQDTTKGNSSDHEGFECDNRPATPFNSLPRSHPVYANVTMIGQGYDFVPLNKGLHTRRGTWGEWYNTLWTRWKSAVDCDDRTGTDSTMLGPNTGVYNSIWYDVQRYQEDADLFGNEWNLPGAPYFNSVSVNPNFPTTGAPMANILTLTGYTDAGFTTGAADFRPIAGSLPTTWLSTSGSTVLLPAFFDPAGNGFVGAISAGDPNPWYDVWSDFSQF